MEGRESDTHAGETGGFSVERVVDGTPDGPLPLEVAEQVVAVHVAVDPDSPLPAPTARSWQLARLHATEPVTGLWWVRRGGEVVGWAELVEPEQEYTDTAFVSGGVLPRHRERGAGRALLEAVRAATDRPVLRLRARVGGVGERVLAHWGFTRRPAHVISELGLAGGDWASRATPPQGYRFERWHGPTPDDLLADMAALREAINDAPDAVEFEAYPPARVRTEEAAWAARGQTQFTVVARHEATGSPAGLTLVLVDEESPRIAHQVDTSVLPDHRGHELGLRLKADMAGWLRRQRPDVAATQTWNAEDNVHMRAVNDRLGAREVARNAVWVRAT